MTKVYVVLLMEDSVHGLSLVSVAPGVVLANKHDLGSVTTQYHSSAESHVGGCLWIRQFVSLVNHVQ